MKRSHGYNDCVDFRGESRPKSVGTEESKAGKPKSTILPSSLVLTGQKSRIVCEIRETKPQIGSLGKIFRRQYKARIARWCKMHEEPSVARGTGAFGDRLIGSTDVTQSAEAVADDRLVIG